MSGPSLNTRLKNFVRFRRAFRRAEQNRRQGEGSFESWLSLWQEVTRELDFELLPADPLSRSSLRGRYCGLETTVVLCSEEIRVITRFDMTLPGRPAHGLLEALSGPSNMHEITRLILAEHQAAVRRNQVDGDVAGYRLQPAERGACEIEEPLGFSSLQMSESALSCRSRYVHELKDYRSILSAMSEIARALTVPAGADPCAPRIRGTRNIADT